MTDITERKQQLHDQKPKRIRALKFGLLSIQDIVGQGVVEVNDRHLYDLSSRDGAKTVTRHGPLDPRLGTSNNALKCETCDQQLKQCNGHFGYVRLSLPTFHVGFMKNILETLHCICKVALSPPASTS